VQHKEYDPGFDNTMNRFLFRKVLKCKIPLRPSEENFYDKRYMRKAPDQKDKEKAYKKKEKEN